MKRALLIIVCALLSLSLTACGKSDKEDFKEYVSKRNDIVKKEQKLFKQAREAVPSLVKGKGVDEQKKIVSDFDKLVKEAKSLDVESDDLKKSNDEFAKAVAANAKAVELKMQGAEKKDPGLEFQSQSKLREAERLGEVSEMKLKEFAQQYNFELK
ncbi:hypothetical protein ACFFJY_14385 [Fictibacillus aquaticus]|uniref:Lipoprotein n=1 Tax=Fictibacillus aquaticus TaxID=2021314 RepID=A0A235FEN3_9BACL|nr:hypothetical protein [Fictibacillus aquaticus]OYD59404.1 hypothetical protein CGZ90_05810 [Fictibacillus aquaticus]